MAEAEAICVCYDSAAIESLKNARVMHILESWLGVHA